MHTDNQMQQPERKLSKVRVYIEITRWNSQNKTKPK